MKSNLKILYILPIEKSSKGMPYSKRQIAMMEKEYNFKTYIFFLENRSSISYLSKAFKEIKKVEKEFDPDICHAHYGSVSGLFAALFCPQPFIITFHGSDLNKTPSDGIINDFLARLFSNITALMATKVIVVSEQMKKMLWWKKNNIQVIPIGTDINEFYTMDKEQIINTVEEFKFTYPTIVFNANHPKIKRLDLAEGAVQLLKRDFPHANLFKLDGSVDPSKIPFVLNAANVLLLCSDNEGSPTIIKEAMACNLPIVSTKVGDVKERVEKVNEALIVEQNVKSIYNGLKTILTSTIVKKNGREELMNQGLHEKNLQKEIYTLYKESIASL